MGVGRWRAVFGSLGRPAVSVVVFSSAEGEGTERGRGLFRKCGGCILGCRDLLKSVRPGFGFWDEDGLGGSWTFFGGRGRRF